jgi:hypothetical protein
MRGTTSLLLASLSLLVLACGGAPRTGEEPVLRDDPALGAELLPELASADYARAVASIRSCRAEPRADRVTSSAAARARALLTDAQRAQLEGDLARSHALLRQAAAADPSNAVVVYHLARSSEERGDTAAAVTGYCRFLRLDPTEADAAETRARLLALWQPYAAAPVPAPVATAEPRVPAPRPVVRRARSVSASRNFAAAPADDVTQSPRITEPAEEVVYAAGSNGAVAEVEAPSTTEPVSVPPAPTPAPRSDSHRGAKRGAIMGAAAGAIVGAATGGKLKHVLIGTAAGAILGAVTGEVVASGTWAPTARP